MRICAVIMAGGVGERFWPKSRQALPKQFLKIGNNDKTMIQLTVERILPVIDIENIFIVTNKKYKKLVSEQILNLPERNIICEPAGRNTAPCLALAASIIEKIYGNSIMVSLASDHLIADQKKFHEILNTAVNKASSGSNLITLGIAPQYAETGYGYIKYSKSDYEDGCFKVEKFVEKPNLQKAEEYVAAGSYLWNSGMFVWQTSVILDKFKELMPEIYLGVKKISDAFGTDKYEDVLNEIFSAFSSESIDYGIMEKTSPIYTIPSDFGWDDVGSWLSIDRIMDKDENGNIITGNSVNVESKNITIIGSKKLIAAVGLEDIVIVDTDDAVLICSKNKSQDIKKVLQELKNQNKKECL